MAVRVAPLGSLGVVMVGSGGRVRFSWSMVGGLSAFGRASGVRFVVEGMAASLLLDG